MRCKVHDLACGPDGRCVVCRREGRPRVTGEPATRAVGIGTSIALAALAATMGGAAAYRAVASRNALLAIQAEAPPEISMPAGPDEPLGGVSAAGTGESGQPARKRLPLAEAFAMFQAALEAGAGEQGLPAALEGAGNQSSPPALAAALEPVMKAGAAAESNPTASRPDVKPDVKPDVNVVIYTTGWCGVCKRAKAWMRDQGIAYEERDVERSTAYASAMRALNPRGSVPTFDVDGEVMIGFSEQNLVATMKRAARREAVRRPL